MHGLSKKARASKNLGRRLGANLMLEVHKPSYATGVTVRVLFDTVALGLMRTSSDFRLTATCSECTQPRPISAIPDVHLL